MPGGPSEALRPGRPTRAGPPVTALCAAVLACLLGGCGTSLFGGGGADADATAAPPKPPRSAVALEDVATVGPYIAATVTGRKGSWRFYFAPSETCRLVIGAGHARYQMRGTFGTLRGDQDEACEPMGVSSLAHWRDGRPRYRESHLQPRVQAAFEPVHRGPGVLLLRGRFPLAMEIRWPEPMDTVAVLPDTPACRDQLLRSASTMEFHPEGDEVFVLEGPIGDCPIEGFALPLREE